MVLRKIQGNGEEGILRRIVKRIRRGRKFIIFRKRKTRKSIMKCSMIRFQEHSGHPKFVPTHMDQGCSGSQAEPSRLKKISHLESRLEPARASLSRHDVTHEVVGVGAF